MRILFVHPNMPGQYKHVARELGKKGTHEILFLTKHKTAEIAGVKRLTYALPKRTPTQPHRYLLQAEAGVIQGQHVCRIALDLRAKGFTPDIVIGHPGWGDMLFLKDVWPNSPMLSFCEFFYRAEGADVGFDPNEPFTDDDRARVRMKNHTHLQALAAADAFVAPTWWQWSVHPRAYRPNIQVLHEGIDTAFSQPNTQAVFTLPNGQSFTRANKVVTYIARNFEPYRGFPSFLKAAKLLLAERSDVEIIAVGADGVSYGKAPPKGSTYRELLCKELGLENEARLHFVPTVPYDQLMALFQISSAHLYLTYPFVLSWSLMEAMACGAPIVGSRTKPLMEVLSHEQQGLHADFFSPADIVSQLCRYLDAPEFAQRMGNAARAHMVQHYALADILPKQLALIEAVANRASLPLSQPPAAMQPILWQQP